MSGADCLIYQSGPSYGELKFLVFLCHYDHIEWYIDKFKFFCNSIHVGLIWFWNSCVWNLEKFQSSYFDILYLHKFRGVPIKKKK